MAQYGGDEPRAISGRPSGRIPLVFPEGVADAGDMANGTLRERSGRRPSIVRAAQRDGIGATTRRQGPGGLARELTRGCVRGEMTTTGLRMPATRGSVW